MAWAYDITERKRAEAELAEKEALLSTSLTNMSDGIYVIDSDMRYVMFNERYLDVVEVPRDEIEIGKPMREVVLLNAKSGF